MRASFRIAAVFILLCSFVYADDSARFNTLGHHHLICTCGCNQILLECNHVGCTVSSTEINELTAAMNRGESDDLILQDFVQKYGPTVLAAPTTTGFNVVAWIMPFLVFGAGIAIYVSVVRNWKLQPASVPPAGKTAAKYRDRVRQETEY